MPETRYYKSSGAYYGVPLAMILSYSVNKSIGWAAVHGFCSWIYVLYFAVTQ